MGGYARAGGWWHHKVNLGTLQYGQSKDVLLPVRFAAGASSGSYLEASLYTTTIHGSVAAHGSASVADAPDAQDTDVPTQRCRAIFVDALEKILQILRTNEEAKLPEAQVLLNAAIDQVTQIGGSSEEVEKLLLDMNGQCSEAISRWDYFTKWGVHYLPSL